MHPQQMHLKLSPDCQFTQFLLKPKDGSQTSQDISFATNRTESSILSDSRPPGSMSSECLLIIGRTPFVPASMQSYFASYNAIARPENVNYKHPEMETVTDRIDTFVTWPHKDIQEPTNVATAGFYYTLNHDLVRCFCCNLGLSEWDECDNPWTEHARHSPACWYLKRVKGQQFIDDIQKEWRKSYNPKFPNLKDEGDRLKTFSNWPNNIVRPTSIDIAKAGFFYTGRGDECRCFYCDGGLQHWEIGDNPWEQHAYYFPSCKFVLKTKEKVVTSDIRERFVASAPNVDALMRESEEAEENKYQDSLEKLAELEDTLEESLTSQLQLTRSIKKLEAEKRNLTVLLEKKNKEDLNVLLEKKNKKIDQLKDHMQALNAKVEGLLLKLSFVTDSNNEHMQSMRTLMEENKTLRDKVYQRKKESQLTD
ncbi:putative inhibitor of apoptosis [Mytilus edulis]|uniref:putative inhibitor of apoptosis n=1 Tax=Mytilus edulis TaxID=6550 RepID=UPI0039F00303